MNLRKLERFTPFAAGLAIGVTATLLLVPEAGGKGSEAIEFSQVHRLLRFVIGRNLVVAHQKPDNDQDARNA